MTTFNLNRTDLDFLLAQVNIGTDYSQLVNALDPGGLREVSGANNNLVGSSVGDPGPFEPGPNTTVGQADQPFLRLSQTSYNPTGPDAAYADPGNGSAGNVADATPRLVSNLIATSFTSGDDANPAAIEAVEDFYGFVPNPPGGPDIAVLPNAGVLGGGRYNAWFVAFGQFFDHGLDFVQKGASGTITIDIKPGDPLFVEPLIDDGAGNMIPNPAYTPGVSNIMRVSRANLANPDSDFVNGNGTGALKPNVEPIYNNNTGLLIDQSQTYGSHATMNAFLREYDADGNVTGRIMTGHTVDPSATGPFDVGNPPPLNPAGTGLATWADIKANALRIGIVLTDQDIYDAPELMTTATGELVRDGSGNAQLTGNLTNQAFLIDINPAADPNNHHDVDEFGNEIVYAGGLDYDAALLDAHYVTGDGRANENYLLTAVHHVFHEEHNFQVENIRAAILATADDAFIAEWQTTPGVWDGEKLFQAARLITESEYNHIAIDQYVGTLYGALAEFVSYSSDINMGVSLEFSQAVFRLGHSMLTETFKVANGNGFTDVPLLEAFLNPTAFAGNEAEITAGLVRTYGNEVDEFVTPALQQSLLGQPLDLATINIARGRDVGLPTHNELRQQIYQGLLQYTNNTNSFALAPYTSWTDYGDHLKHPGTLINMIAAYARDDGPFDWGIDEARQAYLADAGSLDAIRDAAQAVVDAYADASDPNHGAAVAFMEGTPVFNGVEWEFTNGDQGFWDVDLWIGGLAERPLFDGPLGTTFSYILLDFAQRQQDGDRFYYLYRTPMGTHLGDEIVQNQFGQLVERATGLEHLNGEVFITPDHVYELNNNNNFFNAALETITYPDLSTGPASGGHLIIAGNGGNDHLVGGLGDDTIYGDAGNDSLFGSQGNDHLFGGDGDDYVFDDENDDFITGGLGNDRLFAGPGALDTVFGDEGDDEIHGGDGIDELLGGEGDDRIYGDGDTDVLFGDDGNDYLEGGDSVDEMWGARGNDWMRGGVGDDHLNGGDGNDLLEGGIGAAANDGDRMMGQGGVEFGVNEIPDTGFDVISYEDVNVAITANLDNSNLNGTGALIDSYAQIEGMVGSRFNDNLTGAGPAGVGANGPDNLLIGGAGNEVLTGLGGDDMIFGDSVVVINDLSVWDGITPYTTIVDWKGTGENRPDFGALLGLGHILGDNATAANPYGTADQAVFSGERGDYTVTQSPDGTVTMVDTRGIDSTAVGDTVKDVELFRFSDGVGGAVTLTLVQLLNAAATDIAWNGVRPSDTALPGAGAVLANLSTVDPDSSSFTYSLRPGSSANFAVSAAGVVTRTGSAMAANTTYTLIVRSTDNDSGGVLYRDETFTIRSNGTGASNNLGTFATALDDILYGNGGNDTNVNGGNGNDTLFGQAGADVLNGDAGNDELTGGTGNDTVNGGAGLDTFTYRIGDGTDAVDGGADFDTLNVLGTAAAANTLGAVYNGTVLGSVAGGTAASVESITADLLTGIDTLTYAGTLAATSVAVNLENGTASGFASIAGIENVTGGSGNDTLTGDGNANVLNGGANGGADTLTGGGGADTLIGGNGDDAFIATIGDGNDSYSGGNNTDTYDLSATLAGANVVLGGSASSAEVGVDSLNSIENIIGSQGDDTITGSGGTNRLDGEAGIDTINAGGGADTLVGGVGNDIMNGGAGNDAFVFVAAGFGNDTISGFDANPAGGGQDHLDVSALWITAGNFGVSVTIADNMDGGTLVTIGSDTINLLNVLMATVDQSDFILL